MLVPFAPESSTDVIAPLAQSLQQRGSDRTRVKCLLGVRAAGGAPSVWRPLTWRNRLLAGSCEDAPSDTFSPLITQGAPRHLYPFRCRARDHASRRHDDHDHDLPSCFKRDLTSLSPFVFAMNRNAPAAAERAHSRLRPTRCRARRRG
jgi:hypothetical protein